MFAEERQKQILDTIKKMKRVTVGYLSNIFSVTGATIRADLTELERLGYISRTHGGAMLREEMFHEEDSIQDRNDKNLTQKLQIAQKAMSLIQPGDTLIIDTGTTMLEFARKLNDISPITVITNDLKIALELQKNKGIDLIFIGGRIRNGFECTVGEIGLKMINKLSVDKVFMSANALSIAKGATTPNIEQAEMKRRMLDAARSAYLLCDSSKIGQRTLCSFAKICEFTGIITDDGLSQEDRSRCLSEGVNIY